ncbi:dihydrolipoyllysine-residue acetyltransferase [Sugiyamaella lignohabitans]|uniref:Acetyltransferase component of pyruvate dehydrogenase complex n=1 Tax=Sugiyamaella lignohabitans TaxID=796027 RepID=A0A170QYX9_9ASCO|nr:dihydrolipoyllysine-residue acetyltransferase [Sugiyamaella lignohabitans]ANB15995.1 dihydrolipoyllysine-residue acetyltransferase [Sugiyamaella lignohabitans]
MPALSPTMTQGNIGAWQKAVGDQLAPGEPLVEIETDKATMDFEFQEEGYLAKILLETGSKDIPVGKPIGVYVEDEADVAAFADFSVADIEGGSAAAETESASSETKADPGAEKADNPVSQSKASDSPASSAPQATSSGPSGDRLLASPIAKLIALEKGIPLKDVKGSGPNGRIIKRDVENYKPAAPAASTSAPAAATGAAAATYEDIPISAMRKTIASRLTQSKQINPDYIVSSTVSVSKLQKLRASLNASGEGKYKISVNDILIKAIAVANAAVPQANSAWLEKEGVIRQYKNVDVSVAVATPTGLITPVVRNVEAKGLAAISAEVKALGKKARDGKLAPEEYLGGTITISNMGMNPAVSFFTAIINPPQSTILAVGTVERRAIEDPESETGIAFDDVITLTASFDHKVVDGAVGAEWIKALKRAVENPLELLL